jgi:two-component system response regulator (stage 0 sporulation protein F)
MNLAPSSPVQETESTEEQKNKKAHAILLAEDDREMRKMLAEALRRAGYSVQECPDGLHLLNRLGALLFLQNEGETIDLIISDVRMPGASGQEVLEQFHNCQGFPPMILITAFGDELAHAKAEWFGAAAMFDKPFDVDQLIDKVGELLPRTDQGCQSFPFRD